MQQPARIHSEAKPKVHWAVRVNYQVRAVSFAAMFIAIGMHLGGRGYGTMAWVLLVLQFLVYPHLLFRRAQSAAKPLQAELANLILDCLLAGVWAAALEFPLMIASTLFIGVSLNNTVYRGRKGSLVALVAFSSSALLYAAVSGFRISPDTDLPVTAFCMASLAAYVISIGNLIFTQSRKLQETRHELRKSEENYRLITENAGDLIAMLDAEGHWVYTSPSYRRLLSEEALAAGVSALLPVHREDRDMVRAQLKKSVETGESQEFLYRLVASDGSANEFQATVNSFLQAGQRKVVIVSIDITELRRRDKALAIQAHAFENMAEGMMITAADGMILSVNRAFTAVTGYGKDDVVGKNESEFRIALQPPKFYDDIRDALAKRGYWTGITWSRRKDNEIYRERHSVSAIRDESGHTTHYIIFFSVAGDGKN